MEDSHKKSWRFCGTCGGFSVYYPVYYSILSYTTVYYPIGTTGGFSEGIPGAFPEETFGAFQKGTPGRIPEENLRKYST